MYSKVMRLSQLEDNNLQVTRYQIESVASHLNDYLKSEKRFERRYVTQADQPILKMPNPSKLDRRGHQARKSANVISRSR